jgi:SAM-dependent methyltransferase
MQTSGTFRSYWGAVAVPILDKGDGTISTVTHDWSNATAGLSGGLAITILRLQIRNYRVDIAKERLAELAISNNCDFVFFLDDDVICPPDTLIKMIRLWRSDPKYKIISGVYWSKSDPPMPLIFKGNLEGSYWDWTTDDLITADGAGAGCLFVDTEVFKNMPKPWFSNQYFFEDPRSEYDLEKWHLTDALAAEFSKGKDVDKKKLAEIQKKLVVVGEKVKAAKAGVFDPNLLKNKHADVATTEDLFFFKKAKESLGEKLWIDCSIQCQHQDKKTGKVWMIGDDSPQANPQYKKDKKPKDRILIDIGAGTANYWTGAAKPIRVDNDPKTNPDVLADARHLPFEDCYADEVFASHMLEHFSFRETINVLREWVRVLKRGGRLSIVVPNLKWASRRILDNEQRKDLAERAMFMYYSGQQGDLKSANKDFHKSGFTSDSLKGVLNRLGTLKDIEVYTSEGNIGNWDDVRHLHKDDEGYNIVAFAKKAKHEAAVSLTLDIPTQEAAKSLIGDEAKRVGVSHKTKIKKRQKTKAKKAKKNVKKTKTKTKRAKNSG